MRKVLLTIYIFVFAISGFYPIHQVDFASAASDTQPASQPTAQQAMPEQPYISAGMPPAGQPQQMGMGTNQLGSMPQQAVMPVAPALETQQANQSIGIASTALSEEEISNSIKVDAKEKISLDLKGIDINELFRILSLKMNITIVPSKSVAGRVNIFLNNLTFDDALDVILISQDLACDRNGDIISIMTSSEFERLYGKKYNEKRKMKSVKLSYAKPATVFNALAQIKSDIGKLIVDEASGTIILIDTPEKIDIMEKTVLELDAPPAIEVFDIKYAKTADIKTQLSTALTAGAGEIYTDERASKVIVSDLPDKMRKIKRMVKAFDEPSRQVFIEAEVFQLTLKDEFDSGIDWSKVLSKDLGDGNMKGVFPVAPSFTPSPLMSTNYWQLAVAILNKNGFNATLKLLSAYGDTKILSRPRISVVNNQEAKIMVGTRDAYITQSQSQSSDTTVTAENVQFIDVGVKLNVTPTINTDGYVTMKIKPEVSTVHETITTALGSRIPIVETSEAETTVKVKDNTMIMIAGMLKDEKRDDRSGFPFLARLPFLGLIFGTHSTLKKRTEIIVFITPHIITGDATPSGSEFERLVPPDIVPDDIEVMIIKDKVNAIRPQGEKKPADNTFYQEPIAVKQENAGVLLKMKGMKDVK